MSLLRQANSIQVLSLEMRKNKPPGLPTENQVLVGYLTNLSFDIQIHTRDAKVSKSRFV